MKRTLRLKNKPIAMQVAVPYTAQKPKKSQNGKLDTSSFIHLATSETILEGIRQKVFLDRYSFKDVDGKPTEFYPEQLWERVANGIAMVEKTSELKKYWAEKFYWAMEDFKFVPAGRILSGAGTGYEVTFFNCYVIPSPRDSRGGIMENITHTVEIQARAGGVGVNLSSLRPSGARVRKVNGTSSGPVNWASLYSTANHDVIQQGGCFAPGTLIMTHRGLTPVKEIVESKSDWFVATHQGYRKVTSKFDNGIKKLYEVKTEAGFKVEVTAEHKLLTVDKDGRFYLKRLADFKAGESTVLLLGDWFGDLPYAPLNTSLPAVSKYSNGRKNINLPKYLDEDLAFLIGVYDADGSKVQDEYSETGKGLRIAVAQDRPNDLKKLTSTIRRIFNLEPIIHKGDGAVWNVCVYGREINEFLKLNGLLKEYSINVEVPEIIFTSPKGVVEAYLAGVFSGDGSNRGGKGGFRIATVSEKYASQLQLLLINLGIVSRINVADRSKKGWRTIYTVTVNGSRFMKRFYQMVLPYTEKAGDKAFSKRDGAFNWPFNLVDRFVYLSGFQRTMARTNPTTSYKSVHFLEQNMPKITDRDREDIAFLASCVADKIVSIKEVGEQRVYDLEVDQVHLFSGNGFYTSNSRRGALMLMLNDWHPDVIKFIHVKEDLTKIPGANLSVCVSDKFMQAVENDEEWSTKFPDLTDPGYDDVWDGDIEAWEALGKKMVTYETYKARDIWDQICEAAWRSAEPGVHFLERSNKEGNTWYFEKLLSTNPCGEQPLGAWAVCNLGAMNLAAFVKDDGVFDYSLLEETVKVAMRFMDNVVDANFYFYEENEIASKNIRRTGIGTMGLGDAMIKMKVKYGSQECLEIMEKIYKTIRDVAYETSSDLAIEKGPFPKFEAGKYLQGHFIQRLPEHIKEKISEQGIRNAVILTQAPTGTTSILAGVSSGIEPVYDFAYVRKDRTGTHTVYHPLYQAWKEAHSGDEALPEYFVSANSLTPEEHVQVQAVAQKYTDSSISKTVNAPNSHTVEDVKKLYRAAYELGCKGVTYFRDGSRTGVLSHIEDEKEEKQLKDNVTQDTVVSRPMILRGRTYKIQTPVGEGFITINRDDEDQPFEVFITVGRGGTHTLADAEAIGRLVSLALRLGRSTRGITPAEIAHKISSQLRGIGGASHIGFGKDRVMSLADAIAKALAEDLALNEVEKGQAEQVPLNLTEASDQKTDDVVTPALFDKKDVHADLCPECGDASLVREEGCYKCYSCGYSKC